MHACLVNIIAEVFHGRVVVFLDIMILKNGQKTTTIRGPCDFEILRDASFEKRKTEGQRET